MNEVVRGPKSLERIAGIPAIVVIPYIETPLDIAMRNRKKKLVLVLAVVSVIVIIAVTHFFVMSLDLIWATVMMKLGRF